MSTIQTDLKEMFRGWGARRKRRGELTLEREEGESVSVEKEREAEGKMGFWSERCRVNERAAWAI